MTLEDIELVCHEKYYGSSHGKTPKDNYRIIPKEKAILWGARKCITQHEDKPKSVLVEGSLLPSYIDAFQDAPGFDKCCFTDFNNACGNLSDNVVRNINSVLKHGWCGAQDEEWKYQNTTRYIQFLEKYGTDREKKVGVWREIAHLEHHEIT